MKNHILLIADGRSAITSRWIDILIELGFMVTLVSTYPTSNEVAVERVFILPVAFSGSVAAQKSSETNQTSLQTINWKRQLIQHARPLVMNIRYLLGPSTLPKFQKELNDIIKAVNPDLVHALRVPYEGMLASAVPKNLPLLVSIWGNDFTLHARANAKMGKLTRKVMERANGVLADVQRDITLAHQWGLSNHKPTLVVPGGGGIHLDEIKDTSSKNLEHLNLPKNAPLIINPRGIRAYAQTDTFFQAIPAVLEEFPDAVFLCPGMKGKPEAEKWVNKLTLQKNVRLFDTLEQQTLWAVFHHSQLSLSITTHDGTPNTLIEAMACGCFPIAGDIDSIREWIIPGVNGLVVDPQDPKDLAKVIILALNNENLRNEAKIHNQDLIKTKAEVGLVKNLLRNYYSIFLQNKSI
jgi:glycosyltransferase involved in cell wall biosynthesis